MTDVSLRRRGVGRPRKDGSSMGLMDRIRQWRIGEKCAEYTDEYIDLLVRTLRGQPLRLYDENGVLVHTDWPELADRIDAGERLMNRAHGRPTQRVDVDQTSQALTKVVYEVRWMPPDPNDKSVVTVPEPD